MGLCQLQSDLVSGELFPVDYFASITLFLYSFLFLLDMNDRSEHYAGFRSSTLVLIEAYEVTFGIAYQSGAICLATNNVAK